MIFLGLFVLSETNLDRARLAWITEPGLEEMLRIMQRTLHPNGWIQRSLNHFWQTMVCLVLKDLQLQIFHKCSLFPFVTEMPSLNGEWLGKSKCRRSRRKSRRMAGVNSTFLSRSSGSHHIYKELPKTGHSTNRLGKVVKRCWWQSKKGLDKEQSWNLAVPQ